ncbi:BTB/POZ domain-containing protein [Ananas comosus]|uniref:BTB/POZ domain-containing protein n=1 Tax=Ananas comosus TaxID=4615 RepID=A0A199UQH7_ANACO|nr:BTB/POZ domain-containing protein [Ananas comosus]
MKFMKLGTRPDTFITTEATRSVSSEVSTDLKIKVQNRLYLLHKFPLLSKCLHLQTLCAAESTAGAADHAIIELPAFPGGADAFEICAKFCYEITVTLSAANVVPVRCAAEYLQMTEAADCGNLIAKIEVFFKSCILPRWKDTLVALQCTRQYAASCEELRITGRCVDSIAMMIADETSSSEGRWAEDICVLGIDHYWRIMVAVKSAGTVSNKIIGDALYLYTRKWLPIMQIPENSDSESESLKEITSKHRLLLERVVSLLPAEKGAVSCSFLLNLLKAVNILDASVSSKMELARRVGVQLEEATVADLLIPSRSSAIETLHDVDIVMSILQEFMLQEQSPPTSPMRVKLKCEKRRPRSSAKKRLCRVLDCRKLSVETCIHAVQNDILPLRVVVQVLYFYERARAAMPGDGAAELTRGIRALLAKSSAEDEKEEQEQEQEQEEDSEIRRFRKGALLDDQWSISGAKYHPKMKLSALMKLDELDDDVAPREGLFRSTSSRIKALCAIPSKPNWFLSKLRNVNRSITERH